MTAPWIPPATARRHSGVTPIELADCAQFKREHLDRVYPQRVVERTKRERTRERLAGLGCFDEAHSLAPVTKDALGWGA